MSISRSKSPKASKAANAARKAEPQAARLQADTFQTRPEEFTVAEFADWIQDGIQIWQQATSGAEVDQAFAPLPVSGRTSLVLAVVKLSQQLPYRARTRFQNGLVFAVANWTGIRPIAVLQTLVEVCTELRPLALIDHLHRFVASSMLEGARELDRERTIDLAVTLAVGYPFDHRIELFFDELKATGRWRPRMAARKVLAQTLAKPDGWLEFTKACIRDWKALKQTGRFNLTHIFGQILSAAGTTSVVRAVERLRGDDDDAWIIREMSEAPSPVLERENRGEDCLIVNSNVIQFSAFQRGELNRDEWVASYKRRQFLDSHLPAQSGLPKSEGGDLIRPHGTLLNGSAIG